MAFTLIQAGNALKSVNTDGGLSPALTLPAGVSLATNLTPRFAKFKSYVIVVNTPTRPLTVGTDGTVRLLTPSAPSTAVVLSAGAAGTLTGTYLALQTYRILDALGNVIAESDYSPLMAASVAVANQNLHAHFPVSSDPGVNATQLYRTTTNGSVYFPWTLVPGNTLTDTENSVPDAGLGTVAGPSLGPAPDLTLIAEWAGRLWGVARTDVDTLRWTEAGMMYAWSTLNALPIQHVGDDAAGITTLIPRRAALGVTKRNTFQQVTGSDRASFKATVVNGGEKVGCVSQESVVTFNDISYFLWQDGVYKWDSNGITPLTNGKVRSWFTSDTYFNRSMFWKAFAQLDRTGLKYQLFLASTGSSVIDRWIEYDIINNTWWGPHKTDAFRPTCAFEVAGRNQQPYYMVGSQEGYISQQQEDKNDWTIYAINASAVSKIHTMEMPDHDKFFGELSILGKVQPSGLVTITPTVGELEGAVPQTPFSYDMTKGRQRLFRLGTGKQCSLQFDHSTINEDVVLYGYEINPVNVIGRR